MITIKREICQHCGVDFTNRPYSEKIHHQNTTNDYSMEVLVKRVKKYKCDPIYEIKDNLISKDSGYKTSLEIAKCLIKRYREGIYFDGKTKKFPDFAKLIEENIPNIKQWYIDLYQSRINKIKKESERSIKSYKELIESLPQ